MSVKLNALLLQPTPADGQSLEQEISTLISRYGKKAVAAEIAKQTKSKRGPKPKPDWLALSPVVFEEPPAEWSVDKMRRELTASGASIGVLGEALLSAMHGE